MVGKTCELAAKTRWSKRSQLIEKKECKEIKEEFLKLFRAYPCLG